MKYCRDYLYTMENEENQVTWTSMSHSSDGINSLEVTELDADKNEIRTVKLNPDGSIDEE